MENLAAAWAVVAQCVVAGYVAALSYQHWADWRADRDNRGAFWLMAWTAALAALFFVNGLVPTLRAGFVAEACLFLRSQLLAASLLLFLPSVQSLTHGRRISTYVAGAGGLLGVRAVLWLTTDLVFVHGSAAGIPQYGSLLAVTLLAPLAVVVWYGAVSTGRMHASRARYTVQAAVLASFIALVASYLMPHGRLSELLTSVWAIPLVGALQAMRVFQVRAAERSARRQHGMREALAALGNAAWFTKDRVALLLLAQNAAREQLDDPTIVGSIRALSRGRFSTEFQSAVMAAPDDLTRGFLDDLRRLVSVAAQRTQLADELRDAAFTDPLTLLPNRRALERRLTLALDQAAQDGTRIGVLYCDIDGFKVGNDQHGHAWGDRLLRRTAQELQASVGSNGFVARFGGDEFVVVIETAGTQEDLLALAERVHTGPDRGRCEEISPLLSVGVASWSPGDSADPELLLREADTAMFEGKRHPSGVVVFDDALRAHMVAEQRLRRELDSAISLDEFELYYQPIVNSTTLDIASVEALVRWQHPDGIRMPAQWIGFAEETGLIVPIGRRLVVAARAGARRLRLPVAVNFAARQLAEPHFLEHLRLDWGDEDWHLLTLEITESALLEDLTHVLASLTTVRALGARVSIDDFGTGYSSFARLATLPVDVLKIDQAFVRDLDRPGGVAVVRAIVTLAQAYGLDIIAEGVETREQLRILVELGVPKLQGYLLGRPSAAAPRPIDLEMLAARPDVARAPLRRAASV